jgi:hypothetical protein
MRYIELKPVRAGMVDDPADYPWSSYAFNAIANVKQRVQDQLNRRVEPKARGGDRKSDQYKANRH